MFLYCTGVGALVGASALVPTVAIWVWMPIWFTVLVPLAEMRSLFGG